MSERHANTGADLPRFRELEAEYEFVRELGRGGTAVVYLARDRELGRSVAIKVVRATYVEDPEAAARIVREARTVAGLQHPNIVMLYGTRRLSDRSIALIMQYVPGQPLKEVIRRTGQLPTHFTITTLTDIAKALDYAHQRRIVHRDIKPENIYLDREAKIARLSDFGIARPWDTDSGLTLPGVAIGTPAYMSPEQIDGKELDGRSDLYSLGLVGYEMLTGQAPWAGENVYQTIFKQKHEALRPLRELRPGVPDKLALAISGCLAKNRELRWGDPKAFIRVLEGARPDGSERIEVLAWSTPGSDDQGDAGDGGAVAADSPTIRYRRDEGETIEAGAATETSTATATTALPVAPRELPWSEKAAERSSESERGEYWGDEDTAEQLPGWGAVALVAALVVIGAVIAFVLPGRLPFFDTGPSGDAGVASAQDASSPEAGAPPSAGGAPSAQGPPADGRAGTTLAVGAASGIPASLSVLSGGDQVGAAGAPLPIPLTIAVRDSSDRPVAGVRVSFAVVGGGGAVVPSGVPSNAAGLAETTWRLGGRAGENAVVATVEGHPELTARFDALATASSTPAGIGMMAGEGQTGRPGGLLTEPVRVRVTDGSGAPMARSLVVFEANPGSGGAEPDTATTDQRGIAEVRWRLGAAEGTQSLRAYLANDERTVAYVSAEAVLPTPPAPRLAMATGGTHTCALDASGFASCWGENGMGQLGDGTTRRQTGPARVVTGARFTSVTAGLAFTCGLAVDGRAYCWGGNGSGQLGSGGRAPSATPQPVATDERFTALGAGQAHACGLTREGRILCWGSNESGRLGIGNEADRDAPALVLGGYRYSALAVGWGHTCALVRDGRAVCWGRNASGELGDGSGQSRTIPNEVATGGLRFVALTAGSAHTCGLTAGGNAHCWGQNAYGQLGDGGRENRLSPVSVGTNTTFRQLAAGGVHTCGLAPDGTAHCWGRNVYGQLGDGTVQDRAAPVPVTGGDQFTGLATWGSHTCGQTSGGATLCWGLNTDGQLGDGSRTNRSTPVRSGG